jgi:DNA-binding transcriptional LysR family regulator
LSTIEAFYEPARRGRAALVDNGPMSSAAQLAALRSHDLNQLTVLQALLAAQSVTRAARQLDLSQPAISKSLERLRREFDDPLLVRDGNRMRLTPRAQELLPRVEAALDQLAGVFAAHDASGPFEPARARGRLRIGANDYVQLVLGARLLRRLRERTPQVTLEFRPVGMLHPEHLLTDGLVDIVIGPKWPNLSLRWQPLYRDPFVCVVGGDDRAVPARLDAAGFCALEHLDVSPSGIGMLRTLIDRALADLGVRREVRSMCSSFMAVPALLAGTRLAALVPQRMLALFPAGRVRVVELDFELPPYEVSLWWHNVTHADPLARWVREQLVALGRDAD